MFNDYPSILPDVLLKCKLYFSGNRILRVVILNAKEHEAPRTGWFGSIAFVFYTTAGRESQGNGMKRSGQQHLKLSQKDIKKTLWIQGGGKALFLDTESA
ncbi:MAG: hypothetical protein HFF70_11980, partial [Oscillospiraceae bacterium]|nr:hypothetical protein [Oscillospiraceae bacterium]